MPEAQSLKSASTSIPPYTVRGDKGGVNLDDTEHVTLCEALDRVLNKGAVIVGEVTISVADVDLIYLGLQLILTSIETAREAMSSTPIGEMTMKDDEAQGVNR